MIGLGDVLEEHIDLVAVSDEVAGNGERSIESTPLMNEAKASRLVWGSGRRYIQSNPNVSSSTRRGGGTSAR